MKIVTTLEDLKSIPWDAIFRCGQEYKDRNPSHNDQYYCEYMRETWGIDQGLEHIKVVDEQKYLMFLLRWA